MDLDREFAREFAEYYHRDHTYQGHTYFNGHLRKVARVLADYGFDSAFWASCAFLHDVMEDCMLELKPEHRKHVIEGVFGKDVADVCWRVTGIGTNRKERNRNIKTKILEQNGVLTGMRYGVGEVYYKSSAVLKLADRIANVESAEVDSKHKAMYRGELLAFSYIKDLVPEPMWERLIRALEE